MSKYNQVVFQCNHVFDDGSYCFYKATYEVDVDGKTIYTCGYHKDDVTNSPHKVRAIGNRKWVEVEA